MVGLLQKDKWPAYFVGLLLGLLLTLVFLYGTQIGASTGIARISALIEQGVSPSGALEGSYFERLLADQVIFNWKVLFVLGIVIGAVIGTKVTTENAPPQNTLWIKRFGSSKAKRFLFAFIGGALLMVGARLANGCTSGHAISGGAQLSLVSWVFMCVLFASAISTSFLIYKR